MAETDSGRLLVARGDRLEGLVTRSAILRFVQVKNALEEG